MRTITAAALVIALLPATAFAQKKPATARTEEQLKRDAEVDKAYQKALKATKDTDATASRKVDPWQTVRTPSDSNVKK